MAKARNAKSNERRDAFLKRIRSGGGGGGGGGGGVGDGDGGGGGGV